MKRVTEGQTKVSQLTWGRRKAFDTGLTQNRLPCIHWIDGNDVIPQTLHQACNFMAVTACRQNGEIHQGVATGCWHFSAILGFVDAPIIPSRTARWVPSAFVFTALAQTDLITSGELMARLGTVWVDIVGSKELQTKPNSINCSITSK